MPKLSLQKQIMAANQLYAEKNRKIFDRHKIIVINLMASPGAGKTTLIEALAKVLKFPIGVIEGDLAGEIDLKRLEKSGIRVVQINTGSGCHLNPQMINRVLKALPLNELKILIIENIGNLVCPAGVPLGEDLNLVLLSVTEGEDKPQKYPVIFYDADAVLINKIDLLPHLQVKVEKIICGVNAVSPQKPVFQISALNGEGIKEFAGWLKERI